MIKTVHILLCLVFIAGCAQAPASRWKLRTSDFAQTASVEAEKEGAPLPLPLRGVGVKTLFMMRVFTAAFYMPADLPAEKALEDVPKSLEVRYFVSIGSSQFKQYTIDRMKANLSPDEFNGLNDRFALLDTALPSVKNGDVLLMSYAPGQGTSFIFNGASLATVPGADFAKGLFATWIGPKPFDAILKKQVLGIDKAAYDN